MKVCQFVSNTLRLVIVTLGVFALNVRAADVGPDPDQTWKALLDGNTRYAEGRARHPHDSVARRKELISSQHPSAIILGCADSRVPPEVIFDQGLGDLFVIRIAGNVAPDEVVASIEYAVAHLGSRLIIVLGHQSCGAVAAAIEGGEAEGHLGTLIHRIAPAAQKAKAQGGDTLDLAVRYNVQNTVAQLKDSVPILDQAIRSGKVKIIGARYDLATGKVELVP
jgi:carbonic anhydrase